MYLRKAQLVHLKLLKKQVFQILNNSEEKDDIYRHLCIDKIFRKMLGGTLFFSHTAGKKGCVTQCVCGCVGVAVEQGSSVFTIVYINLPTIEEGRCQYNSFSSQEL